MRYATFGLVVLVLGWTTSSAEHSWGGNGGYHWARTTSSFDLKLVNSTTADWDTYVTRAAADWSASSSPLNIVPENGDTSTQTRRHCNAQTGRLRICNLEYGMNGWLGVAGIYIDANGHITKGYTKLNDSYFSSSFYDNFEWRQSVTCQELGHDIGLDHQDDNFNNQSLYSCMDYQNPPFPYPNAHDYYELDSAIYAHLDTYDSYDGAAAGGDSGGGGACNSPPGKGCNKGKLPGAVPDTLPDHLGWGLSFGRRGQAEQFLRIEPDGTRVLTLVIWALGE